MTRYDSSFKRHVVLAGAVFAALAAALLLLAHGRGWGLNGAAYSVVACVAGWAGWVTYRLARYRCRACGRRIGTLVPPPASRPGQPITFACDGCGITWDTGLKRVASGTSGP